MIKQLHLVPVIFLIFSNSGFGFGQIKMENIYQFQLFFFKRLNWSISIYITYFYFSVAGVVLETHLCRATCHRHDAGRTQWLLLLLLLHGLHGLVWISRKFTTGPPRRGGAGGMLEVFFGELAHEIIKNRCFLQQKQKRS